MRSRLRASCCAASRARASAASQRPPSDALTCLGRRAFFGLERAHLCDGARPSLCAWHGVDARQHLAGLDAVAFRDREATILPITLEPMSAYRVATTGRYGCNIRPVPGGSAMVRRLALAACLVVIFVWALGPSAPAAQIAAPQAAAPAGPIKLARHPDYHAGKIAFSYMGDIWTANEDGSGPMRLTVNTALEVYPRFSPDGRWIAFSSNRFGNNDVFVIPATGGTPRQLTFFSGGDDVVGWSRDGQQVLFRSSHGDGAFPNVATLYQVPVAGGPEKPLPMDWGYYGDFSPDGKAARLQPPPGRRGRASTIAAATRPTSGSATSRRRPTGSCSPASSTTATGRCGAPTTTSISSPIRCPTTRP